ncbi:hypothetical protein THAOC_29001 [Thalassiosira oceanica]|uniref:Uncharacterized protein n=1 Tax=Thalassiosira oceanica TaxID=159749 RepID=K0RS98_THAOC|nr:hypothetical protein THAOC_29001 [Thalassiosira oceanica]|eukprot:EJK51796.1 hypothetical protein THAOC_29001 [Thalassiosira oceanica]
MDGLATKTDYAGALRGYQSAVEEMRSPDRKETLALSLGRIFGMKCKGLHLPTAESSGIRGAPDPDVAPSQGLRGSGLGRRPYERVLQRRARCYPERRLERKHTVYHADELGVLLVRVGLPPALRGPHDGAIEGRHGVPARDDGGGVRLGGLPDRPGRAGAARPLEELLLVRGVGPVYHGHGRHAEYLRFDGGETREERGKLAWEKG